MDTVTLTNRHGIHVTLNPLGACWTSCVLPLSGGPREILLGSNDLATMLAGSSYLGASVGRYAGRIANARFAGHALATNQFPHILHGGPEGFSRQRWQPGPSPALAARLARLAADSPHFDHVQTEDHSARGSEDATWYMQRVQARGGEATYCLIGCELAAGHHHARFDINEDALLAATDILYRAIQHLNRSQP